MWIVKVLIETMGGEETWLKSLPMEADAAQSLASYYQMTGYQVRVIEESTRERRATKNSNPR